MALVPLGQAEITIEKNGTDQTTETVTQGDNIEILNYITDQGSISDLNPGDSASSGYYDSGTVSSAKSQIIESGSLDEVSYKDYQYEKFVKTITTNKPGTLTVVAMGQDANQNGVSINHSLSYDYTNYMSADATGFLGVKTLDANSTYEIEIVLYSSDNPYYMDTAYAVTEI